MKEETIHEGALSRKNRKFMMSAKQDTSNNNNIMMSCCASCGKAEDDDIQLRTCTACKSVRYCGVTCQRNHRPKHKRACKKRSAELRDEALFKQPESRFNGDCPICCLPLPLFPDESIYYVCCSKLVCNGCVYSTYKRSVEQGLEHDTCPFCRDARRGDAKQKMMKRVQANDPMALCEMGRNYSEEGNYAVAFHYYCKAAELGDALAHFLLSCMYRDGEGVERDEKKYVYHAEEASIGGCAVSRLILAEYEERKGRYDRAVKHYIIGANLGSNQSMQTLNKYHARGLVSKEDFDAILRAHQAAVDAMKSPQRDEAEAMKMW